MDRSDELLFGTAVCPRCKGREYVGNVEIRDAREAQPCYKCKANVAVFHPRAAVGQRAINCLQVMLAEEGYPAGIDTHELKGL